MRINSYIKTTIFLIILGCNYSKDEALELVMAWQGKTISLDSPMVNIITNDTIHRKPTDFTIVRYVDSLSCTSCKMRIRDWNLFFKSIDTIPDISYEIFTILAPKDDPSIKFFLKRNGYKHPVIIDYNNTIQSSNNFPINSQATTFLLDKNMSVILIGDPTQNESIGQLYFNTIKSTYINN